MAYTLWHLTAIMVMAGLLGGSVSYFLLPADGERGPWMWLKSVAIAVVAALVIPLFLNTISSTLVSELLRTPQDGQDPTDPALILYFSGFCLLAAVSSRTFLQNLSAKVLQEAQQAKEAAAAAKEEVKQMEAAVSTLVEPDKDGDDLGGEEPPPVDEEEKKILEAVDAHPQYSLRAASAVAREIALPTDQAVEQLERLAEQGLVKKVDSPKGERWAFTQKGRRAIAQ